MRRSSLRHLALALLVVLAAACTQLVDAPETQPDLIVVTAGSDAPRPVGGGRLYPHSTIDTAVPSIGGSETAPVSIAGLGCTADDYEPVALTVTFTISGQQRSPASFKVNTVWTYDGTAFVGSAPTTVSVPVPPSGAPRTFLVGISLHNPNLLGTGDTTVVAEPFDIVTVATDPPGQQLRLGDAPNATVFVRFTACETPNTEPHLLVPEDITAEATSETEDDETIVEFMVTAGDSEDGELTPQCEIAGTVFTPDAEGKIRAAFPIGETEVTCSVTDSGGLTTTDSFFVYVQDTTAPTFTAFPSNTTVVATDIDGYALDLSAFTIAAADYGPLGEPAGEVSPPVTITCTIGDQPADGFQIAIGQTATVSCVAEDSAEYRAPVPDDQTAPDAPNVSAAKTFDVFVTLDTSAGCGFEPPLRLVAPFSAHKINSTIPHKFCPPAYSDGTPATDLASGLKLYLKRLDSQPDSDAVEVTEFATGSTQWRYDDGHYIFNLKTDKSWAAGQYQTTVSYNDIVLATTELALRK